MRFTVRVFLGSLGLVGCMLLALGQAQPPTDSAIGPLAEDPAFQAFFNPGKVGEALANLDAKMLTDYALLLAHGEKSLLRARAGITSTKLLGVAVKVAAEQRDQASLKRLETAIKAQGDPALTALLEASVLLTKASRRFDPSGQSASPEALAIFKSLVEEIKVAKNLNDRNGLDQVKRTVNSLTELPPHLKSQLTKIATEAAAGIPEATDSEDDFLSKLARASRAVRKKAPAKAP